MIVNNEQHLNRRQEMKVRIVVEGGASGLPVGAVVEAVNLNTYTGDTLVGKQSFEKFGPFRSDYQDRDGDYWVLGAPGAIFGGAFPVGEELVEVVDGE
jgi:hypothetical protein